MSTQELVATCGTEAEFIARFNAALKECVASGSKLGCIATNERMTNAIRRAHQQQQWSDRLCTPSGLRQLFPSLPSRT